MLICVLSSVALAVTDPPAALDNRSVHPFLENVTILEQGIRRLNTQLYTLLTASSRTGAYDRANYCSYYTSEVKTGFSISRETVRQLLKAELERIDIRVRLEQYQNVLDSAKGTASGFLADLYVHWLRIELRAFDEGLTSIVSTALLFTEGVASCFVEPYYSVPLTIALHEFQQTVPHLLTDIARLDQLVSRFFNPESAKNRTETELVTFAHIDDEFRRVITDVNVSRIQLSQVFDAELMRLENDVQARQELDKIQRMNVRRFLSVLNFTSQHLSQFIQQLKSQV